MRKFLLFLVCILGMSLMSSCMYDYPNTTDYSVRDNSQDVIIFLHSPTCGNSLAAKEYIDANYPSVRIRFIDVDMKGNAYFLKAAQQDYGVGKDNDGMISTPVICMGDNFIEGWDYYKREALDSYILRYLPSE